MEKILLTHPHEIPGELELVAQFSEWGLGRLHVRKPKFEEGQMRLFLEELIKVPDLDLVLHSHYDLALEYPVTGIHLTGRSREEFQQRNESWKWEHLIVSTGFHDIGQVLDPGFRYQYVFLSPVFPSISKPGYSANFNKETLLEMNRDSQMPVFALGGIDAETIQEAEAMGFSGAGILGGVWHQPDPLLAFKQVWNINT